jgi:hypothetical protein
MRKVVIYNDYRPEKYDLFMTEFERQKIEVSIFNCIQNQNHNIVEKISESFKSVIREAKKRGDEEIAIFEDDIMFPNEKGWEYFLKNKPDDYDIYIGGSYMIDNRIEYKPPIVKVPTYVGNQCIIVNERYYDTWLNTDSKEHCDSVHKDGLFYLCFPMIALQRPGWSANHSNGTNQIVNYNPYITNVNPEYIY